MALSLLFLLLGLSPAVESVEATGNSIVGASVIHGHYFDLIGRDMGVLRDFESACDRAVSGCGEIFDIPESFPQRIRIVLSESALPLIGLSSAGAVILQVHPALSPEDRLQWVIRALLTRYGRWQGVEASPPLWLVRACRVEVELKGNMTYSILLKRRLSLWEVPTLRERLGSYDLHAEPGWDYLIYQFIKSGGLDQRSMKRRLLQFWKNAYDWSQLTAFFDITYPDMNPAELSLLWATFVSEFLAENGHGFLPEGDSLRALERISTLEVMRRKQLEKIGPDLWFLYRRDEQLLSLMAAKKSDLSELVLGVHPYYYNACLSLGDLLEAVFRNDLKGFRKAAQQYKQDVVDARQLGYETDGVIDQLQKGGGRGAG